MGGHGHEHHHKDPYRVPSASEYKLEDAPELLKHQEKLAQIGLKDPWIRNYIFRYDKKYGTMWSRGARMFLRGVPTGAVAFAITLAIENALGIDYHAHHKHDDSNGHGDKAH